MSSPDRILAIDWSGAAAPAAQRRHIVAAEVACAHIHDTPNVGTGHMNAAPRVQLRSGRTRAELIGWLCENVTTHLQSAVIGFDFSFALPASFSRQHGCCTAPELWELVARNGEEWLRTSLPPFWGRPGKRRPPLAPEDTLRQTERDVCDRDQGIRPKSTFQIGGAGAVGTGSLRGMPLLLELRRAGYSIWPFDPPRFPIVVEIYPRLLTQKVIKKRTTARCDYLSASRFTLLPEAIRQEAAASEDAFDALVSALVMQEHAASFACLHQTTDSAEALEGRIWRPDSP